MSKKPDKESIKIIEPPVSVDDIPLNAILLDTNDVMDYQNNLDILPDHPNDKNLQRNIANQQESISEKLGLLAVRNHYTEIANKAKDNNDETTLQSLVHSINTFLNDLEKELKGDEFEVFEGYGKLETYLFDRMSDIYPIKAVIENEKEQLAAVREECINTLNKMPEKESKVSPKITKKPATTPPPTTPESKRPLPTPASPKAEALKKRRSWSKPKKRKSASIDLKASKKRRSIKGALATKAGKPRRLSLSKLRRRSAGSTAKLVEELRRKEIEISSPRARGQPQPHPRKQAAGKPISQKPPKRPETPKTPETPSARTAPAPTPPPRRDLEAGSKAGKSPIAPRKAPTEERQWRRAKVSSKATVLQQAADQAAKRPAKPTIKPTIKKTGIDYSKLGKPPKPPAQPPKRTSGKKMPPLPKTPKGSAKKPPGRVQKQAAEIEEKMEETRKRQAKKGDVKRDKPAPTD